MPELTRINPVSNRTERLLFCHVPRTGGRTILQALSDSGWVADFNVWGEEISHPTYWHLKAHYKRANRKFPKAFALSRHPMRRLESAFFYRHRAKSPLDMWSQIAAMKTEDMYTVFDRHIRPANDLLIDGATVYPFEAGFDFIFKKLKFAGILDKKTTPANIGVNERTKVDWQKAPEHVIEKVVQVYAQDYYSFEYELFPED